MPSRAGCFLRIRFGRHGHLLELEAAILRALTHLERLGVAGAGEVELQLVPENEEGGPMRVLDGDGDPLREWTPSRPVPATGANVIQLRQNRRRSAP